LDVEVDALHFADKYSADVSSEIAREVFHVKHMYNANFSKNLSPFALLSEIVSKNLEAIFPNICVALRIFCTLQ